MTYILSGTVRSTATGELDFQVNAYASSTTIDEDLTNNTASDSDAVHAAADVQVTITHAANSVVSGATVSYTIVVTNAGPHDVSGLKVQATISPWLSNVTWTASFANGSGSLSGTNGLLQSIFLEAGGTATYILSGRISQSATGELEVQVSANPPMTTLDDDPANNTASDSDSIQAVTDLQVAVTKVKKQARRDMWLTYVVMVSNAGPSNATAVQVTFAAALGLRQLSWAAVFGNASGAESGTGPVSESIDIEAGGSVTYTIRARVRSAAKGRLKSDFNVTAGASLEPDPSNNSARLITRILRR